MFETPQTGTFTLQSAFPWHVLPPHFSGVVGGGTVAAAQWTSSKKNAAMGKRVQKRGHLVDLGVGMCVRLRTYSKSRAQRNPMKGRGANGSKLSLVDARAK